MSGPEECFGEIKIEFDCSGNLSPFSKYNYGECVELISKE